MCWGFIDEIVAPKGKSVALNIHLLFHFPRTSPGPHQLLSQVGWSYKPQVLSCLPRNRKQGGHVSGLSFTAVHE